MYLLVNLLLNIFNRYLNNDPQIYLRLIKNIENYLMIK